MPGRNLGRRRPFSAGRSRRPSAVNVPSQAAQLIPAPSGAPRPLAGGLSRLVGGGSSQIAGLQNTRAASPSPARSCSRLPAFRTPGWLVFPPTRGAPDPRPAPMCPVPLRLSVDSHDRPLASAVGYLQETVGLAVVRDHAPSAPILDFDPFFSVKDTTNRILRVRRSPAERDGGW